MATFSARIRSFDQAARAFSALGHRHRRAPLNSRPLGYATTLVRLDADTFTIRHHSTDIVTYHRDGRVLLATGGWVSRTVVDRLRTFVPYGVEVALHGSEYVVTVGRFSTWGWDGSTPLDVSPALVAEFA